MTIATPEKINEAMGRVQIAAERLHKEMMMTDETESLVARVDALVAEHADLTTRARKIEQQLAAIWTAVAVTQTPTKERKTRAPRSDEAKQRMSEAQKKRHSGRLVTTPEIERDLAAIRSAADAVYGGVIKT